MAHMEMAVIIASVKHMTSTLLYVLAPVFVKNNMILFLISSSESNAIVDMCCIM